MKTFFVSFVLLLSLSLFGCKPSSDKLSWHDNVDEALKIAQKENKTVLLNFTGSDWCIWCKRLNDEVFSKDEFVKYAENNLVLVKIDFPREKEQTPETKSYNQQLAAQYKIEGYPTIVLLRKDGSELGVTGYVEGGAVNYVQHLQSFK
ncbi:MAG: thioredoxin family protein [Ignavibacteriaceae bacterium]|nr:thioredoxin family protein [Ignavibacteriaceae bacterium]